MALPLTSQQTIYVPESCVRGHNELWPRHELILKQTKLEMEAVKQQMRLYKGQYGSPAVQAVEVQVTHNSMHGCVASGMHIILCEV